MWLEILIISTDFSLKYLIPQHGPFWDYVFSKQKQSLSMNQDISSVRKVTSCGLNNQHLVPGRGSEFSLHHICIGCGAHPALQNPQHSPWRRQLQRLPKCWKDFNKWHSSNPKSWPYTFVCWYMLFSYAKGRKCLDLVDIFPCHSEEWHDCVQKDWNFNSNYPWVCICGLFIYHMMSHALGRSPISIWISSVGYCITRMKTGSVWISHFFPGTVQFQRKML